MKVLPINTFEVEPWLLEKHYAKRLPMIMYAFGLYEGNKLIGVVTYGLQETKLIVLALVHDLLKTVFAILSVALPIVGLILYFVFRNKF